MKRLLDEVEDVDIENIIDDIASPRIGTELGRDIHYLDYFTNTSKPVKRVRKENKGGYGEKEAEKEEEDYGEEEDYEEAIRLAAAGKIPFDTLITKVSTLDHIQSVFEEIDQHPEGMKYLIEVNG